MMWNLKILFFLRLKIFVSWFDSYCEDVEKGKRSTPVYKEFILKMDESYQSNTPQKIMVRDFIAGMTDRFFLKKIEEVCMPRSVF